MSIDEMTERLLDMDIVKGNKIVFSEESKTLIHQIAEQCENFSAVKVTKDQAEKYGKFLSAEDVYIDMLHKIVDAPTRVHMLMSVRLLIPIISQKLKDEEEGKACRI